MAGLQDGGITQAFSRLAQREPMQTPQSQSPSVTHGLAVHPPTVAVVWQTKLTGQPVWLHGKRAQPFASEAPGVDEQKVPVGHAKPSLQGNASQCPAALHRWVPPHEVAVHAGLQAVVGVVQQSVGLEMQTLPEGQSLSTEQACGGGVGQKAPHADITAAGSGVQT